MKRFLLLGAFCILGACAGDRPETISKSEYGDDWPFANFEDATLKCANKKFGGINRPVVIIVLGGVEYGLNGAAMGVGGYPDAREHFRRTEWDSYVGDAGLIQRGLTLCQ